MICVLFSGGLDSMLLAEIALRQDRLGSLLHISYGQRASAQEFRAANRWAMNHQIPLNRIILSVNGLEAMNQNPGVQGARVVPARNLILISHAINHAAVTGCSEIWYGACADDELNYPDCRKSFVIGLSKLAQMTEDIRICAPLINKSKHQIISQAKLLGINESDAWSCYAPRDDEPCGSCNSCMGRES